MLSYVNHLERVRPIVVVLRPRGDLLAEIDPSVPVFDLDSRTIPESGDTRAAFDRVGVPYGVAGGRAPQVWSDDLSSLMRKTRRLRAIVERAGAAAISTFLHKSHVLGLALRLTPGRRLPVIANVHEVARYLDYHHGPRDRFLMRQFMKYGFPAMDLVVAVADGVRQDLVDEFGVPARKVVIRRNPMDLDGIRRRAAEPVELPASLASDGPLIVAVGRLVRIKGFDVLLRAWARLLPELRARLVIVGDGEERLSLARLVTELGLSDRVALAGQQTNPWKYLARADLVVLSSRTEAFPTVIGEALALGRAIVATDCSAGVREYLDDGRCGVLVPPEDPVALADAIDRLLGDRSLRDRLATTGAARVAAMDLPSAVREYEDALLEVLDCVR